MVTNKVREIMTGEVTTADASSTVFEVMRIMVARKVGRAVIIENGMPVGIFTDHDLLRRVALRRFDPKKTSIRKVMTTPVRWVKEDAHIVEVLGKMYRAGIRHMLVRGERGEMKGLVSMRRIFKLAVELGRDLPEARTVGSIVTRGVVTVDAARSVQDAVKAMVRKDTCAVVVCVGGKPKGIFTSRDLLNRVAVRGLRMKTVPVAKVMTRNPLMMPRSALVSEVLSRMYERNFRHMPILDEEGALIGMVTMADILKYAKGLDVDESVRKTWKEIEEFWKAEEQYTPG